MENFTAKASLFSMTLILQQQKIIQTIIQKLSSIGNSVEQKE
jgi:hypothetical protein